MRPAETGYFSDKIDSLPSITPEIDALVERAVVFRQAYATGSVTRGGQEAVLCGFLGSRDTSLMRGAAVTSWDCLPRIISEVAATFWYHGGQGLFDQQEAFWLSQGVQDTMSLKDFSDEAPRSSWGVGDLAFFQAAVPRLEHLHREAKGQYLLGMTLSLTNHIPWDLPSDLPQDLSSVRGNGHPSYLTTSYTDYALGAFVEDLKKTGLWDDLLMVVVSDHGNSVSPYHDLYKGVSSPAARLDSHVQFFLIGGIIEETLAHEGLQRLDLNHFVSQADTAVLLADVVGVNNKRFFGVHPFAASRNQPLIAILEEHVFSPNVGESWSRSRLSRGVFGEQSKDSLKAQLYYRAFMEFIGMPSPRM
jgi:phosphoglycerol transferase MdoB-like AlkP superfamily enzyme